MDKRMAGPYKNGSRFWGNFTRFAAVGGKREPLSPSGETVATRSFTVAMRLFAARTTMYERALARHQLGLPTRVSDTRGPTLSEFAFEYLSKLATRRSTNGRPAEQPRNMDRRRRGILACLETERLRRVQYVALLDVADIAVMIRELGERRKACGTCISASTVRSYAAEFSVVLSAAVRTGLLPNNLIVESQCMPVVACRTALDDGKYLTRDEVRRLLEEVLDSAQVPFAITLVMTLVYTGMRKEEAMGLLVQDIDFIAGILRVAPNTFRDGKTENAWRDIPLWPALAERMKQHVHGRTGHELVFPAPSHMIAGENAQPINSIKGTLVAAARRAGLTKSIGHHTLRHTYISARLQMRHRTVTNTFVPVDRELVVSEIGHSDAELIKTVYGHVTRERVDECLLHYGEQLPTPDERARTATSTRSERIRAGCAARTARGEPRRPRGQKYVKPLLTPEEQSARRTMAQRIRARTRAEGWSEATLQSITCATPSEVTAIMRGDLTRLPLARIAAYAEAVQKQ